MREIGMSLFDRIFGAKPRSSRPARANLSKAASHGYVDGQTVTCQRCQKRVTVRLRGNDGVVIAVASELETTAFRCLDCGFITCHACAFSATGPSIPVCPSCKSEGGPYFFLK